MATDQNTTDLKGRDKRNSKRSTRILKKIDSGKTTAAEQETRAVKLLKKGDNMSDERYNRRLDRSYAVHRAAMMSKKDETPKTAPTEEVVNDAQKPTTAKPTTENTEVVSPQIIEEAPAAAAPKPSVEIYGKDTKFSDAFKAHRQRLVSAGDNASPEDAFFVWNDALYSARSAEDKEFNYTPTEDMKQYLKPTATAKKPEEPVAPTTNPTQPAQPTTTPSEESTLPPIQTAGGTAVYDESKGGYILPSATMEGDATKERPEALGPKESVVPAEYATAPAEPQAPYIPSYIPEKMRENFLTYDTFVVGEDGKDYKINKSTGEIKSIGQMGNRMNIGRAIELPYKIKDGKVSFSDTNAIQPVTIDNESTNGVYALSFRNRLSGSSLTYDPATDEYYIKSFGGSFRKAGAGDFANPDLFSEILGVLRKGK
jgi:hypothetical protein